MISLEWVSDYIDISDEDLKELGGNGQNVHDGYDLDAIYGYRVLYSPFDIKMIT